MNTRCKVQCRAADNKAYRAMQNLNAKCIAKAKPADSELITATN